jgi:hypothetical protein
MNCKHEKLNQIERKCNDYYWSYTNRPKSAKRILVDSLGGSSSSHLLIVNCRCRLAEWKKRLKVCPYDSNIKSCRRKLKDQKELK